MVIGIFAHVDAGKTTLSEQILFLGGAIRSVGRVDSGSAFLDHSEIERERGITVFSDEAAFDLCGTRAFLVDTPGHADFSGEAERCAAAIDAAVVVISAVDGVQSHTRAIWELLRSRGVPAAVFINKTDVPTADVSGALSSLRDSFGAEFPLFPPDFNGASFPGGLADALASLDDSLTEDYLERGWSDDFIPRIASLARERRFFPTFSGSALSGTGTQALMRALALLFAPPDRSDEPFSGIVYNVRHGANGERVAHIKVESGSLAPKADIQYRDPDGATKLCRAGELREYGGGKWRAIRECRAGELCAVTGTPELRAGMRVGENCGAACEAMFRPLLTASVQCEGLDAREALPLLRELEDEEPLLSCVCANGQLTIRVMGDIQLEVVARELLSRHGVAAAFGEPRVAYLETVAKPVVGRGHFEPLRHYAEVHVRISPNPRGAGVTFTSEVSTDVLAKSWQNLVRTHVFEKEHPVVLTGSPLTDVNIVLIAARPHEKHTEGGDFREATYRAIQQGLMKSESVLLEPWYSFAISVTPTLVGRVMNDIERLGGAVSDVDGGTVRGDCPVRTLRGYKRELTGFTRGGGSMSLEFSGFRECPEQDSIVRDAAYDPLRQPDSTPNSVFCSHGAGFVVKWFDSDGYMHLSDE